MGQAHDFTRGQEVVAHEALDTILAAVACIAHARADNGLGVKGQTLFRPARHVVQMQPHGPQEIP